MQSRISLFLIKLLLTKSGSNNNWKVMEQRVKKVEAMSISDVHQLKCGNAERFDKGMTIEDIFNDARKQSSIMYTTSVNFWGADPQDS
ncbi:unnamed protein product [Rhizophagus irregularis]|nr:unnamed protein product [Rhizophagus irregularis]CAB5217131.1 unnamed protein product [Rhizophagus irregularis]